LDLPVFFRYAVARWEASSWPVRQPLRRHFHPGWRRWKDHRAQPRKESS